VPASVTASGRHCRNSARHFSLFISLSHFVYVRFFPFADKLFVPSAFVALFYVYWVWESGDQSIPNAVWPRRDTWRVFIRRCNDHSGGQRQPDPEQWRADPERWKRRGNEVSQVSWTTNQQRWFTEIEATSNVRRIRADAPVNTTGCSPPWTWISSGRSPTFCRIRPMTVDQRTAGCTNCPLKSSLGKPSPGQPSAMIFCGSTRLDLLSLPPPIPRPLKVLEASDLNGQLWPTSSSRAGRLSQLPILGLRNHCCPFARRWPSLPRSLRQSRQSAVNQQRLRSGRSRSRSAANHRDCSPNPGQTTEWFRRTYGAKAQRVFVFVCLQPRETSNVYSCTGSRGRRSAREKPFTRLRQQVSRFFIDSGSVVSLLPRASIKKSLQRQPLTLPACPWPPRSARARLGSICAYAGRSNGPLPRLTFRRQS